MTCDHDDPCSAKHSSGICARKQRAEARKYDSALVWQFAEIEPGWFALYNPIRRAVELITDDWAELLRHYRARPPFVPVKRDELRKPTIDLSNLEFNL